MPYTRLSFLAEKGNKRVRKGPKEGASKVDLNFDPLHSLLPSFPRSTKCWSSSPTMPPSSPLNPYTHPSPHLLPLSSPTSPTSFLPPSTPRHNQEDVLSRRRSFFKQPSNRSSSSSPSSSTHGSPSLNHPPTTVSDVLWRDRFKKKCDDRVRRDKERSSRRRRNSLEGGGSSDTNGDEDMEMDDDEDEEDEDEKEVSLSFSSRKEDGSFVELTLFLPFPPLLPLVLPLARSSHVSSALNTARTLNDPLELLSIVQREISIACSRRRKRTSLLGWTRRSRSRSRRLKSSRRTRRSIRSTWSTY